MLARLKLWSDEDVGRPEAHGGGQAALQNLDLCPFDVELQPDMACRDCGFFGARPIVERAHGQDFMEYISAVRLFRRLDRRELLRPRVDQPDREYKPSRKTRARSDHPFNASEASR